MKKILSTTAIAGSLCLLGTSAFAQFVGPYVGIIWYQLLDVATEDIKLQAVVQVTRQQILVMDQLVASNSV